MREGRRYQPLTFERRLRELREKGILYSFHGRHGKFYCIQPGLARELGFPVPEGMRWRA